MRNTFKMIISIVLTVIFSFCLSASTVESKLQTTSIEQSREQKLKNDLALTVMENYGGTASISGFDVNSKGETAISFDGLSSGIAVYDKDGNYLYGYKCDFSGSFFVEWSDNGLNVILVRSDLIATYDKSGNCIAVADCTDAEVSEYYRRSKHPDPIKVDGNEYKLENDVAFFNYLDLGYNKLVKTLPDGTQHIIYDAGINHVLRILILLLSIPVVFTVAYLAIIRPLIKKAKNEQKQ